MPDQGETQLRRHARYLRYAAEARELAARTTDSVKVHHIKLALAWEAKAWSLVRHLPEGKPKLLLFVGGNLNGTSGGDAARLALGYRTEAVRGRLLLGGVTRIASGPKARELSKSSPNASTTRSDKG